MLPGKQASSPAPVRSRISSLIDPACRFHEKSPLAGQGGSRARPGGSVSQASSSGSRLRSPSQSGEFKSRTGATPRVEPTYKENTIKMIEKPLFEMSDIRWCHLQNGENEDLKHYGICPRLLRAQIQGFSRSSYRGRVPLPRGLSGQGSGRSAGGGRTLPPGHDQFEKNMGRVRGSVDGDSCLGCGHGDSKWDRKFSVA